MKLIYLSLLFILVSCGDSASPIIPSSNQEVEDLGEVVELPQLSAEDFTIPLSWSSKSQSDLWDKHIYEAIIKHGNNLLNVTPLDISDFTASYVSFEKIDKINFWSYLISAMAKRESNHNPDTFYEESFPDSTGKPVVSRGLLQLSYESSKLYGCPVTKAQDLHDPQINLTCAVKIMNRWVGRDKRITNKKGSTYWQGGGRYWSVMRRTHKSFSYIREATFSRF